MKKIFAILSIMTLLIVATAPLYSQTPLGQSEKIVVNKSDLTPSQVLKIEADQKISDLQKKLDTYGNWVGVGGEIGTAVKEGLTAVVDVADKFGSTNVGKFTLTMVAWKVIGKDLTRIVLGLIFIFVFTFFMLRSYRNTFITRKFVIKDNGWRFWLPKEYQVIIPTRYEGYEAVKVLYILFVVGGFGLTYAIMFG